ncbi:MAG: cupin domain-containing protein [Actinomycetota bacterium]
MENGTVVAVRPGLSGESKQGLGYFVGVSAQTVGSVALCAHLITIPPGGRAKAHLHEGHETIYMLEGEVITWYGDGLADSLVTKEGEFIYIPAAVPHLPINTSATEAAVALVARTDPNEQESVVLLPELDDMSHTAPLSPKSV